jgi:hypothetical protein
MHYVGAIDEAQQNRVSGWAVSYVGDVCNVTVIVNGIDHFVVASDGLRPDLAAKQQSRGAGGFRVDIASALMPGENTVIVTFPDGSQLPGSPITRIMSADWIAPDRLPEQARPSPPTPPVLTLAPKSQRLSPAELEDMSLDDVSHALAHGLVKIASPRPNAAAAPLPVTIPEAAPAPASSPTSARGWLGRRLARFR